MRQEASQVQALLRTSSEWLLFPGKQAAWRAKWLIWLEVQLLHRSERISRYQTILPQQKYFIVVYYRWQSSEDLQKQLSPMSQWFPMCFQFSFSQNHRQQFVREAKTKKWKEKNILILITVEYSMQGEVFTSNSQGVYFSSIITSNPNNSNEFFLGSTSQQASTVARITSIIAGFIFD